MLLTQRLGSVLTAGLLLLCGALITACAVAEQQPISIEPTADLRVPLGFPGHPVTNNDQWLPTVQTFEGVDMVLVPVGCYMMGSDYGDLDEQPAFAQCIRQPFWIDRFEVTNAHFERLGGKAEIASVWPDANRPRTNVSWTEAGDFCALRKARLPSEMEWEYAARGPDSLNYPWGMVFTYDYGVFPPNSNQQTAEVGSKGTGASWVGTQDMAGNVWEWTSTIYDEARFYYPYTPDDGREDPSDTTSQRVDRGSSWYDGTDHWARSANRARLDPSLQDSNIGFRCILDEGQEQSFS